MTTRDTFSLPEDLRASMRRAWLIEGAWIVVLGTIVLAIYSTVGGSQAMKTAWIEDLLSFVPPLAFFAATWIERWPPNPRFPLGYIRVTSISYLVSAVALAGVGLFLIVDSGRTLLMQEHPTIGSVELFGATVWFGWLMIAALAYSSVLPVIFGRLKMRPARELHDKVLYADAMMNKADWMTGVAAIVGILGIGLGFWWADAAAAILIAVDVLHDGYRHTRAAIRDLMDEVPRTVGNEAIDPLAARLKSYTDGLGWVAESLPRLREEGRFVSGAIYVRPSGPQVDPADVLDAERELRSLHWRAHHVSVVPVSDLSSIQGGLVEPPDGAAC